MSSVVFLQKLCMFLGKDVAIGSYVATNKRLLASTLKLFYSMWPCNSFVKAAFGRKFLLQPLAVRAHLPIPTPGVLHGKKVAANSLLLDAT